MSLRLKLLLSPYIIVALLTIALRLELIRLSGQWTGIILLAILAYSIIVYIVFKAWNKRPSRQELICPTCHSQLQEGTASCKACGAQIETNFVLPGDKDSVSQSKTKNKESEKANKNSWLILLFAIALFVLGLLSLKFKNHSLTWFSLGMSSIVIGIYAIKYPSAYDDIPIIERLKGYVMIALGLIILLMLLVIGIQGRLPV